jgi:hypothetical protein
VTADGKTSKVLNTYSKPVTVKNDGTATGRRVFAVRVAADTPEKLAKLALERGHYYLGANGKQGAAGQLMDAIANGEVKLS